MVTRYAIMVGVILAVSVFTQSDAMAGWRRSRRSSSDESAPACTTKEACTSKKSKCQCYCSGIGGFRNKTKNDKPVFVPHDKNKVYCYCKQWDLDAFPKGERPADQPQ